MHRGKREGRLESGQIGLRKGKPETARNMLAKGLDVRMITKVTGLSEADIEALRK